MQSHHSSFSLQDPGTTTSIIPSPLVDLVGEEVHAEALLTCQRLRRLLEEQGKCPHTPRVVVDHFLRQYERRLSNTTNFMQRLQYLSNYQAVLVMAMEQSWPSRTAAELLSLLEIGKGRNTLELISLTREFRARAGACFREYCPVPAVHRQRMQDMLGSINSIPQLCASQQDMMTHSIQELLDLPAIARRPLGIEDFRRRFLPDSDYTPLFVPPSGTVVIHCFFSSTRLLLLWESALGRSYHWVDRHLTVVAVDRVQKYLTAYDKHRPSEPSFQHALTLMIDAVNDAFTSSIPASMEGEYTAADTVIVVPHNELHAVPFCALRCLRHANLLIAQSSAVLQALIRRQACRNASVDRQNTSVKIWAVDASPTPPSMPSLSIERRAIIENGASNGITVTSTESISKSVLTRKCDILHVIMHGKNDVQTPEESRLLLTASVDHMDDQVLVTDILSENLHQQLIVLSACETGHPEEAHRANNGITLVSALLAAGCHTVIGTLWPVIDWSAAIIMAKFYQLLFHKIHMVSTGVRTDFSITSVLGETLRWIRTADPSTKGSFVRELKHTVVMSNTPRKVREMVTELKHEIHWAPFFVTGTGSMSVFSESDIEAHPK